MEPDGYVSEEDEWMRLTPAERFAWTERLWEFFLLAGGSLDPEPDSQSPFDFPEYWRPKPLDGGPGVHRLRSG